MTQAERPETSTSTVNGTHAGDLDLELGPNTDSPPETPPMPHRTGPTSSRPKLPVTLDDVLAARERIMPHLHRTPTLNTATLSQQANTNLSIKCETFQRTGSFKARGAINAILQLTPEQRERGVVTLSAGNHGQGLAFAASKVGARAVVFMPESAVPAKVDAIRGYGAEARFAPTMETVYPAMEAFKEEHGLTFVHPFSDPAIIAGQGVVGLEILEDVPDVETIVVPVGGGGLLAGILVAVKEQRPDVRIVGVEPVGANIVTQSREQGRLITAERIDTIADGLAAPFAGEVSQPIIDALVDDMVLVTDEEILAALRLIIERCKIVVEPAGAAATAALIGGKVGAPAGSRTVSLISGGNIDLNKLANLLTA
ncbi:MAG TPA: threonine/serine dehydratase [Thermomicrobiales bacterium]|nr:threonine/serine dehydratase [Thermomicrobiales bacterium]